MRDFLSSCESDLDERENLPDDWTQVTRENDHPSRAIEFRGTPGLHPRIEIENHTPADYIHLFFTEKIVDFLVHCSNKRTEQDIDEVELSRPSRGRAWKLISSGDMRKFLGYVILMGIVKKPLREQYWSSDVVLSTPFFSKSGLSRDKFLNILKFLRFADCDDLTEGDRLSRIRPFCNLVLRTCQDTYRPEQCVC